MGSNEDLSDMSLDHISQKICNTLGSLNLSSDETFMGEYNLNPDLIFFTTSYNKFWNIESNTKLRNTIDKILNMFEDTSKQLAESHSLQAHLGNKL